MDINHVQLSDLAIGELYGEALLIASSGVARATPSSDSSPAPAAPDDPTPGAPAPARYSDLKFLGKNNRHISLLVHSPDAAFLPDEQLSFLTKMLEACRMNIGDVAIVNTAVTPVTITRLKQQLHPATILFFGVEPSSIRLPINFPAFRPQPYDDCTFLSAPSLDLLVQPTEESRLLNSKLWVCLKSLFNV